MGGEDCVMGPVDTASRRCWVWTASLAQAAIYFAIYLAMYFASYFATYLA
jgi:hypothetical protein